MKWISSPSLWPPSAASLRLLAWCLPPGPSCVLPTADTTKQKELHTFVQDNQVLKNDKTNF